MDKHRKLFEMLKEIYADVIYEILYGLPPVDKKETVQAKLP